MVIDKYRGNKGNLPIGTFIHKENEKNLLVRHGKNVQLTKKNRLIKDNTSQVLHRRRYTYYYIFNVIKYMWRTIVVRYADWYGCKLLIPFGCLAWQVSVTLPPVTFGYRHSKQGLQWYTIYAYLKSSTIKINI